MKQLLEYLERSYTPYQAVENAAELLRNHGFAPLAEGKPWKLKAGEKYYVVRGGSSLVAFTLGAGKGYKIAASHVDSPCLKLKENPSSTAEGYEKLNVEGYGGGIWHTFFDRKLLLAGRVVREQEGALVSEGYVSDFSLVIPSLAIHMDRSVNDGFAPNLQTDLLPLIGAGEGNLKAALDGVVSYDLSLVPADAPFPCGVKNELICSPRADDLVSAYASLSALVEGKTAGTCIVALLDAEEVGSQTRQGAGGDFLRATLTRIAAASKHELYEELAASFMLSLDGAHAVHPNRPEKCDPTNRPQLGGGVALKYHAHAYTTDALSSATVKKLFGDAGVKYQTFCSRSDMRSGSTLGGISLGQVSVLCADLGIPQLAMHSAVETFAESDYLELKKGLVAYFASEIIVDGDSVTVK